MAVVAEAATSSTEAATAKVVALGEGAITRCKMLDSMILAWRENWGKIGGKIAGKLEGRTRGRMDGMDRRERDTAAWRKTGD